MPSGQTAERVAKQYGRFGCRSLENRTYPANFEWLDGCGSHCEVYAELSKASPLCPECGNELWLREVWSYDGATRELVSA